MVPVRHCNLGAAHLCSSNSVIYLFIFNSVFLGVKGTLYTIVHDRRGCFWRSSCSLAAPRSRSVLDLRVVLCRTRLSCGRRLTYQLCRSSHEGKLLVNFPYSKYDTAGLHDHRGPNHRFSSAPRVVHAQRETGKMNLSTAEMNARLWICTRESTQYQITCDLMFRALSKRYPLFFLSCVSCICFVLL